jgi:hypothetical protein
MVSIDDAFLGIIDSGLSYSKPESIEAYPLFAKQA